MWESIIGLINGDTRSLDNGSYNFPTTISCELSFLTQKVLLGFKFKAA